SRNIEHAYVPFGSSQIVVVEPRAAVEHASLLDPATGEEFTIPHLTGNLLPLAPTQHDEWVGIYYSSRQPIELVRFSLTASQPEKFKSLSRVWERTGLTPDDLAVAQDYRWRSVDGLEIQGWLYRT